MNSSKNKNIEAVATRAMRKVEAAKDWLISGPGRSITGSRSGSASWPVLPGAYVVGDHLSPVAVCTLTSNGLIAPLARLPGVAIAGRVYSANLGLEKVIINVTANPAIRFLLVCGKESTYFQTGQALGCLFANGVTTEGSIIGANGHMPELSHLEPALIERFRSQVELVNLMGETDTEKLAPTIRELFSRNPSSYLSASPESKPIFQNPKYEEGFKPIRLGGHRDPLAYDPKGFFIIQLDQQASDILVHHYLPDNSPAHFVRGRNGEAILLALLREGLITQMSHAGYLGAELVKAETAIRLGLHYEQDRPLSRSQEPVA